MGFRTENRGSQITQRHKGIQSKLRGLHELLIPGTILTIHSENESTIWLGKKVFNNNTNKISDHIVDIVALRSGNPH